MIASRTERHVAGSLAPLAAAGYTFLHDRAWPGSRSRAQIDHVLIGPGGVFILDTKAWAEVTIAGGRVFRGQLDVTDDFDGLADVAYGTEAVLAELGLAPGEVHVVIVLAGRDLRPTPIGTVTVVGERNAAAFIHAHGFRLTEAQIDTVVRATMDHFPVVAECSQSVDASVREPVLAAAEPEPLFEVEDITEILLAGLRAEPIEAWMAFLHPSQARLVRREFNGPSRIRGAAGTGKTVVGLHRAAYLARARPGRVLVTSYVKTLPTVLSALMARMAPEVGRRVEFAGVHAFANRLLKTRGIAVNLKPNEADLLFKAVWREFGIGGTLEQTDPDPDYWRDELSKVIKGRGLSTFEQYANLARTGRRRALGIDQRRAVWRMFTAYEKGLRARGIHDFDDQILLAEASLRATPCTDYSAVIIDEAQDLSCAMVRMLHLLVGDAPDGLTLIGDGQQSIYPGGFTLAEAGINIAGRGVVMSTNYRNTREIVEFAAHVIEGDQFTDIEGAIQTIDGIQEVPRTGPGPRTARFSSPRAHDAALGSVVRGLDGRWGDIGVLCATNWQVRDVKAALISSGIAVMDLAEYAGLPTNVVKVGTIKRAKGLEFRHVLVARVDPRLVGTEPGDDEALAIRRRELYVGMTRARDTLWVGVCP
nr:UvrD-helicase domain-containing protein [Galbitalea soli]